MIYRNENDYPVKANAIFRKHSGCVITHRRKVLQPGEQYDFFIENVEHEVGVYEKTPEGWDRRVGVRTETLARMEPDRVSLRPQRGRECV